MLPLGPNALFSVGTSISSQSGFQSRWSVPLLHAQQDDAEAEGADTESDMEPQARSPMTPTKNENDEMGVDFSWDGGTIALVLGALIAVQFFVLANI
jgi:hypothetical protein